VQWDTAEAGFLTRPSAQIDQTGLDQNSLFLYIQFVLKVTIWRN